MQVAIIKDTNGTITFHQNNRLYRAVHLGANGVQYQKQHLGKFYNLPNGMEISSEMREQLFPILYPDHYPARHSIKRVNHLSSDSVCLSDGEYHVTIARDGSVYTQNMEGVSLPFSPNHPEWDEMIDRELALLS
jgi:hypothetical protein